MKKKDAVSTHSNSKVLHAKLAPTCFATMFALGMIMPAQAAIVAGNTDKPLIHTDASGATIVDINKASAGGVSHNVYSEFNVDSKGVILNNSGTVTNTQLAGQIDGNANMASGSAKVILNEVRSSDPSQLNGMVEVAGQSAQVIIANPSGITCDGCGFINTNHATLTTGTATYDNKGNVNGLDVSKGQVTITGKEMDTRSTQYTDIIARSVKVNAKLQANELNIITGNNRIDKNGHVQKKYDSSNTPDVALDVSALGSMYANKIFMEGTDTGVGVHIDHADLTASDALSINVDGVVENNGGHISGKNAATVMGGDVLNHNGQITSEGMVSVAADHTLDNTTGVIKAAKVNLSGKDTVNNHGSIQGSQNTFIIADSLDNSDGEIISNGDLTISRASWNYNAQGVNNTHGRINAKGALNIDAASLNNSTGRVETDGAMTINVDTLTNDNGLISAGDGWNMISASMLNNDNGVIQAVGSDSQIQVSGNNMLSNRNGLIHSNGYVSINGALDNMSGTITADKDLFMYGTSYYSDLASKMEAAGNIDMTVTGTFQNAGTVKAGQNMMLNIGSTGWYSYGGPAQNSGSISAEGRLALQMNSSLFDNSGDITANQMDLQLADLSNSGSIASKNDINLNTTSLENRGKGVMSADHNISVTTSYLMTDAGSQINAGSDATLFVMNNLDNNGDIRAAHDINLNVMGSYGWSQGTAYNFGTMKAGNKLNAQMERVTLINGGTLSADNGITLISNYLTNSGNITSTSDITLNTANGVNNEASGNITGNRVYTTGYVNNMGVINETGAANQGTDNNTADDINTNPGSNATANNSGNTTIKPNGTPEGNGVWENGVVYQPGDKYYGHVVQDIIYYPGGYFITIAA
ncbi:MULTISPECIES: filamentous hemagglutinin N-terminal domain-containing protein [Enterobacter]|uniref:filamentous hemagglutinin N-terminal domain-containing protein n=1 Tax=Enterobacter TaxID=547 RepID=UPI0013D50C63|nr:MULTISPECIES: filamentous hemagglutinin N-terminal domain-containing protein [Enterobacter]NEV81094.1 filamentous hemagglutinin N-terminal domain-containing protein [Enterobacter asburiae]NMD64679.1 filamentous hemagglutinin N-terminal domain-containing protein [Enterobacter sp. DNRA5]